MKKYTEEDFKKFEVDEYGYTICPSGDYTDIKHLFYIGGAESAGNYNRGF